MVPQISKQSQVLQTGVKLAWSEYKAVWWPNSPPFGLKLLWLESTLKILSSGQKKSQSNYPHEELLTSKVREETPFDPGKDSQQHIVVNEVFLLQLMLDPLARVLVRAPSS